MLPFGFIPWKVGASLCIDRPGNAAAIDFRPKCVRVSLIHKTHLNAEFQSTAQVLGLFRPRFGGMARRRTSGFVSRPAKGAGSCCIDSCCTVRPAL